MADPISTKERLAAALREAGAPSGMVKRAEAGAYDDYESDSATPIADLIAHAREYGLEDIAQRAMRGEFDGSKEEADAWAASPEGQRALEELFGKGDGT
jgi:hypothetical protein